MTFPLGGGRGEQDAEVTPPLEPLLAVPLVLPLPLPDDPELGVPELLEAAPPLPFVPLVAPSSPPQPTGLIAEPATATRAKAPNAAVLLARIAKHFMGFLVHCPRLIAF